MKKSAIDKKNKLWKWKKVGNKEIGILKNKWFRLLNKLIT